MIVWMYHVLAHRPGGQPIGALERAFAKVGKLVRSRCRNRAPRPRRGMINLKFFPSRQLAFYMVRLFLTRSLAVLVALVLILMTLDLLGESGKILAVPGNGDAELWHYVALRMPLLVVALPALLGAARDADRLRRPQPAQRGGGDEGGRPVRAPDPRPADRRQPRHRRGRCSPSTRPSSSSPPASVTAWSDNDYQADAARKRDPQQRLDLQRRRSRPRRPCRRQRRQLPRRERHHLRPLQAASSSAMIDADHARPLPDGSWRLDNVRIYDATMNVVRRVPAIDALRGRHPEPADPCQGRPRRARLSGP